MEFYLGTHRPHWLKILDVPLFVSRRTLGKYKTLPRARGKWALDSGGFTELSTYGCWTIGAREYAAEVRRYADEVGHLAWAASQDWMCEKKITDRTGLTVEEHQRRTVGNFVDLKAIDATLPVIPVLQGRHLSDYDRCLEMYDRAGVDLWSYPVVGLGSVCRRQATREIAELVWRLADTGLPLHGFGVKVEGLRNTAPALHSSDSLAWSFWGKYLRLPGCEHKTCANCIRWAIQWRDIAVEAAGSHVVRQFSLEF